MDGTEVLRVLSKITSLDPRWRAEGERAVLEQVQAWQSVLEPVPWWFADQVVTTYYSTDAQWPIRTGLIREQWLKAQQDKAGLPTSRQCAWARLCACDHAPSHCLNGWVDIEPEVEVVGATAKHPGIGYFKVRACPVCHDARNRKRAESGLEPVDL